jgi:class 3 adenylate cyclase
MIGTADGVTGEVHRLADVSSGASGESGRMVDDVGRGLGWPLWIEAAVSGVEERPFSLPTGTVTFVLSDVEGSTQLWDAEQEALTAAIHSH